MLNYLENPKIGLILRDLITFSSSRSGRSEEDFALDATGFGSSRFVRWYDHLYRKGGHDEEHTWVKTHITSGVKTNVVTACEIHGRNDAETLYLSSLLATTARHFDISQVFADKGYLSVKNYEAIASYGATGYIPFKKNSTGSRPSLVWKNAFHYYQIHREEFYQYYHMRSNVESTISMIKDMMGGHVWCTSETAMANEVFAKIVAHNIRVLAQSMYELKIAPIFLGSVPMVDEPTN